MQLRRPSISIIVIPSQAKSSSVVRSKPDVIVTYSGRMMAAFQAATRTIPIIGGSADPVESGLIVSLARPGGKITGVSPDGSVESWGKRLELLREAVPQLLRVGFLTPEATWQRTYGRALRRTADKLGLG